MYLLLLVFGAILCAAGIVLAASGFSIHDRALDATIVTPGIVAVIGGLVLIGLGLALRVLHRIENALAAPIPRAAQTGAVVASAAASELPSEPARLSFVPKTALRPQAATIASSAPSPASPASAEDKGPEDLPGKSPEHVAEKMRASARFERGRTAADTDLLLAPKSLLQNSLSPSAPSRADDENGEIYNVAAARRINGAARARITPQFDMSPRPPATSEPLKGPKFDSLWPKGPRPMGAVQSGSAESTSREFASAQSGSAQPASIQPPPLQPAVAPTIEPGENSAPPVDMSPPTVVQDEAPAAVTVLKTGVVDGMTYTLFSDGSIEAELPQGTLRFGSIAELRNHIEQSA